MTIAQLYDAASFEPGPRSEDGHAEELAEIAAARVEVRLIDGATAERIGAFEAERERRGGRRWPVILAWVFGGVPLRAGVLLFVAAHRDEMSPAGRFAPLDL